MERGRCKGARGAAGEKVQNCARKAPGARTNVVFGKMGRVIRAIGSGTDTKALAFLPNRAGNCVPDPSGAAGRGRRKGAGDGAAG